MVVGGGMWFGLLTPVNIHVSIQEFSLIASDLLAVVLPASQMPGLKIFVN